MSHPDEGVLQAYLDGELDAAELAELRAHLDACEACRAMLQEQQEMFKEATTLVDRLVLDPPVRIPVARRRAWWKSPAVGIAASLAVALSTAVLLWRPASVSRDREALAPAQAPEATREMATDEADAQKAAPATIPVPAAPEKRKDTFRLHSGPGPASTAMVERKAMPAPAPAPAEGQLRDEVTTKQRADAESPAAGRRQELNEASTVAKTMAKDARVARAREITGQAAQVIEASGDTLRSVYVIGSTTVVLEQHRPLAGLQAPAAPRGMDAPSANAYAAPAARAADSVQVYRWKLGGEELVLRGALPVDSLASLAKLVR